MNNEVLEPPQAEQPALDRRQGERRQGERRKVVTECPDYMERRCGCDRRTGGERRQDDNG